MTTKILIPAKAIIENRSATLDLAPPARCSRCNAQPANFFETHPLRYKAGMIRYSSINRKYRTNIAFRLRLPLCETCYQVNFLENPDSVDQDKTPLGEIAKWRSIGIKIAALIACFAFILLMKFIPLPAAVSSITYLWLYLIGLSSVLFAIVFGLTHIKNQNIKKRLASANFNVKLHRAIAYEAIQGEDAQPDNPAVFVTLENNAWAKDCADIYGWNFELTDSPSEKEEPK